MTTTTQTLAEFIAEHKITARAERAMTNPNMTDDRWARDARHWRVILRCEGRRWTVPFSQGAALTQPPTAADVLDCVVSDVAGVRNCRDVADFMAEYGYEDREQARRTFATIEKQDARLQRFLADDEAVETLLYATERL